MTKNEDFREKPRLEVLPMEHSLKPLQQCLGFDFAFTESKDVLDLSSQVDFPVIISLDFEHDTKPSMRHGRNINEIGISTFDTRYLISQPGLSARRAICTYNVPKKDNYRCYMKGARVSSIRGKFLFGRLDKETGHQRIKQKSTLKNTSCKLTRMGRHGPS
jgi:hypothetical protein